jgi:hypothetical protein
MVNIIPVDSYNEINDTFNPATCQHKLKQVTRIHYQIDESVKKMDFGTNLDTSEVLDARRQGATTEAYKKYAARRSDRGQRSR